MPVATLRRGLSTVMWIAGGLILLALGIALLLAATDTAPGRAFIVRQVEGLRPESGLTIRIGRLEGAPLRDLTAHDVVLGDPKGPFLEVSELRLRWKPLAFARNQLLIDRATTPRARLLRLPELNESGEEDQPLLPGFDIRVSAMEIGALVIEPPVAGRRFVVAASGAADVADGRAIVRLDAAADAGDRLRLRLDTRPDDDRFDLDARLQSPANGLASALAGAGVPLSATLTGKGLWSDWEGSLTADAGDANIARADIAGNGRTYRLAGDFRPAALLGEGVAARLTTPVLRLEASATVAGERIGFNATAASAGLSARGEGTLDSGSSRLEGVRLSGRLNDPARLSPELAGTPIGFTARIDGPLSAPVMVAEARAARLAVGESGLLNPRASGRFVLKGGRIEGDVRAAADNASGLGPELAEYARTIVAEGRLAYGSGQLVIRPLAIRTDRVRTTGSLVYDLDREVYLLALKGGIARYVYPGIGEFAVDLDLGIRPGPGGSGLVVAGPLKVRAIRLESEGALALLGGLPALNGALTRNAAGDLVLDRFVLSAPRLQLAGSGRLLASGAIAAEASGRSADYGPLAVTVAGTVEAPRAELRMPRPDAGVGLTGLVAVLRPDAGGYAVNASGDTDYGPASVDARLLTGGEAIEIDLRQARIAGLLLAGRLRPAGDVYAGTLDVDGSGVSGTVRLSADRGDQRADATLMFSNARLDAVDPDLTVADGRLAGFVVLRDGGPEGQGRLTADRVRRNALDMSRLELAGNYAGGNGRLNIAASGRNEGKAFDVAADAVLTPGRITVGAAGEVAGGTLRLAGPAVVLRNGGEWQLQPTTLLVENGRAVISGRWGEARSADILLQSVSLEGLGPLAGIDVSGVASGRARVVLLPSGLPNGSVELKVRNVTRSGIAATSLPVDIELAAAFRGTTAAARGYLRREGRVLGAAQLLVSPIAGGDGEPLAERLLAAPVSGVLRLSAPAEAIWPLAGVETLDVQGPIGVTANIRGRVGAPVIAGNVRATGARLESAATGTVITKVNLLGVFNGSTLAIREFSGDAGSGRITGGGTISFDDTNGLTAKLTGELAKAQLVSTDTTRATVSGPVQVTLAKGDGLVSGKLDINSASYTATSAAIETVPTLAVRETGMPTNGRAVQAKAPAIVWRLAVKATARNRLEVKGLGLDSEWEADVEAGGTADVPRVVGTAELVRGTYDFAGRSFTIEQGNIRFQGANPPDPILDIRASTRVTGLAATIRITGTALRPEISFTSTPVLPEDEVLSRLLFGTSVTDLSAPEAVQLAASLAALRGGSGGGFNPITSVKKLTGLDRLRVVGEDEITGRGTSVAAGKYLTRNIYVEVTSDAQGYTATQVEIALTRAFSLLSTVQTVGGQKVSVRWSKDY